MSYRNDHDAALARVDVLETEVERLRKLSPAPPALVQRTGIAKRTAAGVAVAALLAGGIATAAFYGEVSAAEPADRAASLDARVDRMSLDACIADIAPMPDVPSSRVLTPTHVHAVDHSAAGCDVRVVRDAGTWAPSERAALDAWISAEDNLSNAISMIDVYYAGSATLDRYASARQLGSEYERARFGRDAAIAHFQATR
jgi:hypothetical protein